MTDLRIAMKEMVPTIVDGDGIRATDAEVAAGTEATKWVTPAQVRSAQDVYGVSQFATVAQGAKADTAVQPGDLATVATSGAYSDLSGLPTLGTAAAEDIGFFATAAQGALADTAVQPAAIANMLETSDIGVTVQAHSAVLDATTASFTTADETKLDGIEAGADVTDATNVAAAGAVMESDTSTASMSFAIDEDDMASNSATKFPVQQSVKAYTDANRAFFNVVDKYNAVGDGTTDNDTAFGLANTAGGLVFIPKPAVSYDFAAPFTTTLAAWLPDPTVPWAELTDSGNFNMHRGGRTEEGTGANIWRFEDRVFIGSAASKFAGNRGDSDEGTHWMCDLVTYPGYLFVNSALNVSTGPNVPYGISVAVKSSETNQHSIGLGIAVDSDAASKTTWCAIFEATRQAGSQNLYGIEFAMKNNGDNAVATPNTADGGAPGVYGITFAGGGAADFGGAAVNPSTAAIVVLSGSHTWNTGFLFKKDALTNGEAIAMSSEGDGGAHAISWYNAAGNKVFNLQATATDAIGWTLRRSSSGLEVVANNKIIFAVSRSAAAVNGMRVAAGDAASNPILLATGDDTNIGLTLRGKGTGGGVLQDGASAAKFAWDTTGIGFFAAAPVARGALAAPSGTITRTTFATSTVTLPQLAERVYAMINDLRAYGLFS